LVILERLPFSSLIFIINLHRYINGYNKGFGVLGIVKIGLILVILGQFPKMWVGMWVGGQNCAKYGNFNIQYVMMDGSYHKSDALTTKINDISFWKSDDFD